MTEPAPIMLDLQGAFVGPGSGPLIARHERYGAALAEESGVSDACLTVVVPRRHLTRDLGHVSDHVRVISGLPQGGPRWWLSRQARSSLAQPSIWIAGDPFVTGPLQVAAARRTSGRAQVQAHGDFGAAHGSLRDLRERGRLEVARRTLRAADSVRAVSEGQARNLIQCFGLAEQKVFVAPVPLDDAFTKGKFERSTDRRSVLFVGRLHDERGLELWAKVARLVASQSMVEFDVVGAGPAEDRFRMLLDGVPNVRWHGCLQPQGVANIMSGSRVLLSTPPLESYGRSLVEALCMGVQVVATPTVGAERLRPRGVRIAGSLDALAERTIDALDSPIGAPSADLFRAKQHAEDDASIRAVARSWLG